MRRPAIALATGTPFGASQMKLSLRCCLNVGVAYEWYKDTCYG